jgi:hypothetical protein
MAVVFNVPWYATGFRGDRFAQALEEIAPVALRYGAFDWAVYRYADDRYKFIQIATIEDAAAYTLYWNGPEFAAWRADHSGWYQVPVVYTPMTLVASGRQGAEANAERVSPARAAPSSAPRR